MFMNTFYLSFLLLINIVLYLNSSKNKHEKNKKSTSYSYDNTFLDFRDFLDSAIYATDKNLANAKNDQCEVKYIKQKTDQLSPNLSGWEYFDQYLHSNELDHDSDMVMNHINSNISEHDFNLDDDNYKTEIKRPKIQEIDITQSMTTNKERCLNNCSVNTDKITNEANTEKKIDEQFVYIEDNANNLEKTFLDNDITDKFTNLNQNLNTEKLNLFTESSFEHEDIATYFKNYMATDINNRSEHQESFLTNELELKKRKNLDNSYTQINLHKKTRLNASSQFNMSDHEQKMELRFSKNEFDSYNIVNTIKENMGTSSIYSYDFDKLILSICKYYKDKFVDFAEEVKEYNENPIKIYKVEKINNKSAESDISNFTEIKAKKILYSVSRSCYLLVNNDKKIYINDQILGNFSKHKLYIILYDKLDEKQKNLNYITQPEYIYIFVLVNLFMNINTNALDNENFCSDSYDVFLMIKIADLCLKNTSFSTKDENTDFIIFKCLENLLNKFYTENLNEKNELFQMFERIFVQKTFFDFAKPLEILKTKKKNCTNKWNVCEKRKEIIDMKHKITLKKLVQDIFSYVKKIIHCKPSKAFSDTKKNIQYDAMQSNEIYIFVKCEYIIFYLLHRLVEELHKKISDEYSNIKKKISDMKEKYNKEIEQDSENSECIFNTNLKFGINISAYIMYYNSIIAFLDKYDKLILGKIKK